MSKLFDSLLENFEKSVNGGFTYFTNSVVDEKLTCDDDTSEWIQDFQDSEDDRFDGDSKEKRKQRALAAYYDACSESNYYDIKYNVVTEVLDNIDSVSKSKNISKLDLWESVGADIVDVQFDKMEISVPKHMIMSLKEDIFVMVNEQLGVVSEGYGRESRIYSDFFNDIKKLPNVDKLIADHALADGAAMFVRAKDGNAYEIQIRPARYAQYFGRFRKPDQFSDRKEAEKEKYRLEREESRKEYDKKFKK